MTGLPDINDRTLLSAYERALADRPDDLAQIDASGRWTFADSFQRSLRIGAGLRSLGAEGAAPVALLMNNSLDFIHVWTGIGLLGMVEVPVKTAYVGRFLSHVLNDSGAEIAVLDARYIEPIMSGRACACRKCHPCRLSGMVVLVENAAEAVASADVKAGGGDQFRDRCGQRAQWPDVCDPLMRPVAVVELLEPESVNLSGAPLGGFY